MLRRIAIIILAGISLGLCLLGLCPSAPIFATVPITSQTTGFFCVHDGLVRVGWFTCTVPIRVELEPGSADSLSLPAMNLQRTDAPSERLRISLGTQRLLIENGLRRHAFDWQLPWPMGPTVYGTQLRLWFGTAALLLGLWPILAFVCGPVRRHGRRRRGLCMGCGYNRAGNISGHCPECGTKVATTLSERKEPA